MGGDVPRALRGIRFAARLGFEIDKATWDAIRHSAPALTRLSAERVKQELEKTMDQVAAPSDAIARWKSSGALGVLIPELADVSDDAIAALDCTAVPGLLRRPGRRLVRMTVLFSDCAADDALRATTRLRFSKADAAWVAALVGHWRTVDPPAVG